MPAASNDFVYPDERDAGMTVEMLQARFSEYFNECARLRRMYSGQLEIFVGVEIETYRGSVELVRRIQAEHSPDYIVGSLHHVNDVMIDITPNLYFELADSLGSIELLYCRYFDQQYEMIEQLKPAVVGHLDLIKLFDPNHQSTLRLPAVRKRIARTLHKIKELDLILDLNLSGFDKRPKEQYPNRDILQQAVELKIPIVPGDDSHGIDTVGRHFKKGLDVLEEIGGSVEWRKPAT
jgi:histidinol-phosphatase (PHP family)